MPKEKSAWEYFTDGFKSRNERAKINAEEDYGDSTSRVAESMKPLSEDAAREKFEAAAEARKRGRKPASYP